MGWHGNKTMSRSKTNKKHSEAEAKPSFSTPDPSDLELSFPKTGRQPFFENPMMPTGKEIVKNRSETITFNSWSTQVETEMFKNRTETTTFNSWLTQVETEMSKNRTETTTFNSWSTQVETEMSKNRTETTTFNFPLKLSTSDSPRSWKYFGRQHWQNGTFQLQTDFLPRLEFKILNPGHGELDGLRLLRVNFVPRPMGLTGVLTLLSSLAGLRGESLKQWGL